jgi:hypothetical protein
MADWIKFPSGDKGWLAGIEHRLMGWLHGRMIDRLLRRYGGIQMCPWCKQCAQAHDGWHFDSKTDPCIDALHCGNCGGVSRWRFELGMMPVEPFLMTPPYGRASAAQDGTEVDR